MKQDLNDSKYYKDQYEESVKLGNEYEQPTRFPLDYARVFYPFPFDFPGYDYKQTIKWVWFDMVFDRHFWVTAFATIFYILFLVFIFLAGTIRPSNAAYYVVGVLFFVIGSILAWFRVNMAKNENYRRSICFTYAKSLQAKKLWDTVKQDDQMYAKDEFYSTKNYLGEFHVLRDGSIEIIPNHLDESGTNMPIVPNFSVDSVSHFAIDVSTRIAQAPAKLNVIDTTPGDEAKDESEKEQKSV